MFDASAGTLLYATEDGDSYASLAIAAPKAGADAAVSIAMPHTPEWLETFGALTMVPVKWVSNDGTPVVGALYSKAGTAASATVLVHAHGGPAGAFPCDRSAAADATRYPYRHVLMAGYRVFLPLFRGTLGFGDEFAIANYRCQVSARRGAPRWP